MTLLKYSLNYEQQTLAPTPKHWTLKRGGAYLWCHKGNLSMGGGWFKTQGMKA